MADLSAIPENTIESFERALGAFGIDGVTVDGDASELGAAQAVQLLDKLSRALGEDGLSFGSGATVTLDDFRDPEKRAEILTRVQASVEGFKSSPHLALVGEILKGDNIDYAALEGHVAALGIPNVDPQMISGMVRAQLIALDPPVVAQTFLSMAEASSEDLKALKEIVGPDLLGEMDQTIALLENSNDWFEVLRAVGDAVVPEGDASVALEVGREPDADDRVASPESDVFNTWPSFEQLDIVAETPPSVAPEVAPEVVVASPPEPVVVTDNSVSDAIRNVEIGLALLRPVVQGELDKKRDEAQALIDEINGRVAPDEFERLFKERQELFERLEEMPDDKVLERATMSGQIQVLTRQMSGGGDSGIAQFIDGFLLGTIDTDLGRRVVDTGRNWASSAVRSKFVGIHDIPELGVANDGVLDMHDQAALQGTLFLLATNFGIHLEDTWRYRPELGKLLKSKLENGSFEDRETLVLGFMRQNADEAGLAAYEEMSGVEKSAFVKEKMDAFDDHIITLISSLDTLHAEGLLVDKQLYSLRPLEVAPFVRDIFEDYIGIGDEQISAAHAGLLNGLVNEFTEGIGLVDAVGRDFALPEGTKLLADDMAQLFRDAFDDVGATGVADFESKLDKDHLLLMVETLPFGSTERREAFKDAVNTAFEVARRAEAANNDAAVNIGALVSTAFGESLEASMAAINENPKMHSDYLFAAERPVLMHPDLHGESFEIEDGSAMDADGVFAVYKRLNNHFESRDIEGAPLLEIDHRPLYFTDENGEMYIAMIDVESYVMDVRPLNIDALEQAIKDGADYEELVEISPGYGLAFQDVGAAQPWNAGTSMGTYDFVENVRRSSWDLADFRVPSTAPEVNAPADRSEVGGEFDRAASPVDPAEPVSRLDEFQATREEIVTPAVPDGGDAAGSLAPVVQQNSGVQ